MADVRRERLTAQLLHRPAGLGAPDVVRRLVAVQAQDPRSARLALRARVPGLRAADVEGRDDLVVSWLLRGTLHLVHRDDLPWLHALAPPPSPRRLAELGVGEAAVARVREVLPFTRAEAAGLLGLRGQAVPWALRLAAHRGVCVQDLAGRFTAVSVPPVPREAALGELTRRYAAAHPGATPADLAAWAGIPRGAIPGTGSDLPRGAVPRVGSDLPRSGRVRGRSDPVRRLLAAFDPFLLGWRDRSFAVAPELRARVFPGGGMLRATATEDGRVVGTWTAPGGRVALADGADPAAFAEEAADVERFLAQYAEVS